MSTPAAGWGTAIRVGQEAFQPGAFTSRDHLASKTRPTDAMRCGIRGQRGHLPLFFSKANYSIFDRHARKWRGAGRERSWAKRPTEMLILIRTRHSVLRKSRDEVVDGRLWSCRLFLLHVVKFCHGEAEAFPSSLHPYIHPFIHERKKIEWLRAIKFLLCTLGRQRTLRSDSLMAYEVQQSL